MKKQNVKCDEKGKVCPAAQFFDLLTFLEIHENALPYIKLSFGDLPINKLEQSDHKKHGAIYVSLVHMEQFPEFLKKKFGKKIPDHILNLFTQTRDAYSHLLQPGTYVTGEHMGFQKKKYNEMEKPGVVLHGVIEAVIDGTKISPQYLGELCELFKLEGYVFVCPDGSRGKLKRAYFPGGAKQKGEHNEAPTDYEPEGLKLCGGGQFGYDNAGLTNVENPTIIAQKNGISLVLLPHAVVIKKQLDLPFDGDKMFNVLPTTGKGTEYMYNLKYASEELKNDPDVVLAAVKCDGNANLTNAKVEVKHDGETVVLHKDEHGEFHLMVKLQVHVWKVVGTYTEYRLGWGK
jgi:hypothetical protein